MKSASASSFDSMPPSGISRRQFMGSGIAAAAMAGFRQSQLNGAETENSYQLFFGDLHNHNAVGYAKGSLERSIDLARAHLDFFAFTGHASWHDLPTMPGDRHMKWVNGFKVHSDHWPKTRELIRGANDEEFVALLGYEWHSSVFGDYCMIFEGDEERLYLPDHVNKLLDFAGEKSALAIPHHVGYKEGWRGANWKYYRPGIVSPVVEVFSEHGCTETDRSPYAMLRHSMGGRSTGNTIQPQLGKGTRFGVVASTDDHTGYPGAYGEGIAAVWAKDLSARALFEAIRSRRTYATTGERIVLEFAINQSPMGSELAYTTERQIDVRVEGQDSIEMIELIRNGRVIERDFPEDHINSPLKLPGAAKCRIQYGWGPWGALTLDRVCEWDMDIRIEGGRFRRALGCFQNAPFGEDYRDRLEMVSETELKLASPTTRLRGYGEDPTKAVICDLEGSADSVLSVDVRSPNQDTIRASLGELIEDNVVSFTGGFTSESFIIHRLVRPAEYSRQVRWRDAPRQGTAGGDYYYVRVRQHNGHMAWSSPIWVGA